MADEGQTVNLHGFSAELYHKLSKELGLNNDLIGKLAELGAQTEADLALLQEGDLTQIGIPVLKARRILATFVETSAGTTTTPPAAQSEDEENPRAFFAGTGDPMMQQMMMMLFAGNPNLPPEFKDMLFGDLMPLEKVVRHYNPTKKSTVPYSVMMSLQTRYGGKPIVAIDEEGKISRDVTLYYLKEAEEFGPVDGTTYRHEGKDYDLIHVGVDTQSSRDEDPLNPGNPLRKQMGYGQIDWTGISLEVRQAIYLAQQSFELNPRDPRTMRDLRKYITKDLKLEDVLRDYPEAAKLFRQAKRAGSLPTMKLIGEEGRGGANRGPFPR